MWWVSIAMGAPLVPVWTVGAHRSVKIDVFGYGSAVHSWGSDWKAPHLEQWTILLDCETTAERQERCSFVQKPVWGWALGEADPVQSVALPVPPPFQVEWTKTGRLQAWDPAVDPGVFGEAAAGAMVQALFHRADAVVEADSKREIGNLIWTTLVRDAASAMELELSRKGEESSWSWSKPPIVARRYSQGITYGRVDTTLGTAVPGGVEVVIGGQVSETLPMGTVGGGAADTRVLGAAVVDPATGRPVRVRWDTATTSNTMKLSGHTHHIVLLEPWHAGKPTGPAPVPTPALP